MKAALYRMYFIKPLLALIVFVQASVYAQPAIQWDKTIGSVQGEYLESFIQTSDGGYLLGCWSYAPKGADKSQDSKGLSDFWVVKVSSDGTKQWDKTFGGNGSDVFQSASQTSDGGYVLCGYSTSTISGDKTEDPRSEGDGTSDYWMIKIASDGTKQWDRTYGGIGKDIARTVIQTSDGGFMIGGMSDSPAGFDKTEDSKGSTDYWVLKLRSDGTKEWDKVYGSFFEDNLLQIEQISDGSYILGGSSLSDDGGDKSEAIGNYYVPDLWIVKITSSGIKEWDRSFGDTLSYAGQYYQGFAALQQTKDGGYIVGGWFDTTLGIVPNDRYLSSDMFVVKLDAGGNVEWKHIIGTYDQEELNSILQTDDGGYILAGTSNAFAGGMKSEDTKGFQDCWIVKLSSSGDKLWDKTIGGNDSDFQTMILPTSDGGYVFGASSGSGQSGDKSDSSKGGSDFWIVKLGPEEPPLPVTLTSFIARTENTTTLLTWSTSFEIHGDRFEVQRSLNGKAWELIGTVKSNGNVNKPGTYLLVDNKPIPGFDNLYRLKMVDTDGTFTYSKIESLHYHSDVKVNIFPNPAAEILTIELSDWKNIKTIQLLNSNLIEVYRSESKANRNIDVKRQPSGLYFVKLTKQDGTSVIQKVIVVK